MTNPTAASASQTLAAQSPRQRRSIKQAAWILFAAACFYAAAAIATHSRGSAASATSLAIDAAPLEAADSSDRPQAVTPQTEFDFGCLPVDAAGEHVFLVRNGGTAPLQLSPGATTCRCTLAELPSQPIAPGDTAEVKVTWTARGTAFSQRATVRTNDPRRQQIDFTIRGKVRHAIAATPSDVVFASLRTGETQTGRITLYSQTWDDFQIVRIEASHPGLKWSISPIDSLTLAEFEARSGYEIEVSSPSFERPCDFQETLRVYIRPQDSDAEQMYPLAVGGRVLSRLALYGVDEHLGISLGRIAAGQGAQRQITLRVRDQQPIQVERIEARPSFLKVTCEPMNSASQRTEQYHIRLEVPADAAACSYTGAEKGYVLLTTNHPREKEIRFEVSFEITADAAEASP